MRSAVVLLVVTGLVATAAAGAASPPRVSPVDVPREAEIGRSWRAVVTVSRPVAAVLEARGPSTLRTKLTRVGKTTRYAARLRFPSIGTWRLSALVGGRRTRLGTVSVDIAREPLLTDPFTVAAEPGGSLLVGQLRQGALLRLTGSRATALVPEARVAHVATTSAGTYVVADAGDVFRLDGTSLTRVASGLGAGSVAVDGAGNVYVTVYAGYVKRVAPDGAVTTIAGDGTEGFAGDGGPGTAAKLFHPHSLTLGADGALYVADTENRRIRRIDLATERITSFGGDVGVTVSVATAPDGSIYSADIARDGAAGGITRTSPDGATTRILALRGANGVTVASDGTVYVLLWEPKRILRLDPATGRTETVARG